jgi:hypothetical protein
MFEATNGDKRNALYGSTQIMFEYASNDELETEKHEFAVLATILNNLLYKDSNIVEININELLTDRRNLRSAIQEKATNKGIQLSFDDFPPETTVELIRTEETLKNTSVKRAVLKITPNEKTYHLIDIKLDIDFSDVENNTLNGENSYISITTKNSDSDVEISKKISFEHIGTQTKPKIVFISAKGEEL